MPKGPQGQKRHADVIRNIVQVMRIATGQEEETQSPQAKAGALGGKIGGKSRAARMTQKERKASAKKAARARWGK